MKDFIAKMARDIVDMFGVFFLLCLGAALVATLAEVVMLVVVDTPAGEKEATSWTKIADSPELWRFEDRETGNVCYLAGNIISCVAGE